MEVERNVNLRKRLKDDAISCEYVTTKFTEVDSDEKSLFEYTDRVGAFIIYILIEAMRGKRSTTLIKKKKLLSTILLDKAIDMDSLFLMFCNLLTITGPFKNVSISDNTIDNSFFNLDTASFGGISYDISAKSRFLLMIEYVQALKVFFNVGY